MSEAPSKPGRAAIAPRNRDRRAGSGPAGGTAVRVEAPVYAALDLGTNNCRLMIAAFSNSQFRIVEAFSRIVRLGEGLSHTGQLGERAMDRALRALKICAEKIEKRDVARIRAVATQACRIALNGRDFVQRVERETGLKLTIITPEEEAHLSVMGCASLLDGRDLSPPAQAALVIDVGGGSTELSWIDLSGARPPASGPIGNTSNTQSQDARAQDARAQNGLRMSQRPPRPEHWISLPVGVVNLAERFPEPQGANAAATQAWFDTMVADVMATIKTFAGPPAVLHQHFECGQAYIVGTSGAITSLAGMHLNLERYDRSQVDGLWMQRGECDAVVARLLEMGHAGREMHPCIGRDRADLVLAGAAILEAVQQLWPCERLRVADRGLREGLLLSMARRRTRHRRRKHAKTGSAKVAETV